MIEEIKNELINENNADEIFQMVSFEEAIDYCIGKEDYEKIAELLVNKFLSNEKLLDAVIHEIGQIQAREEFGYNYNGYR